MKKWRVWTGMRRSVSASSDTEKFYDYVEAENAYFSNGQVKFTNNSRHPYETDQLVKIYADGYWATVEPAPEETT